MNLGKLNSNGPLKRSARKNNAIISALYVIDKEESELDFDFTKSRIILEEQRIETRTESAQEKYEVAAFIGAQYKPKSLEIVVQVLTVIIADRPVTSNLSVGRNSLSSIRARREISTPNQRFSPITIMKILSFV